MDTLWLVLGVMLMIGGLAGSVLPFLPGPPLCYLALLIQQLQTEPPYNTKFLVIWACITALVVVIDHVIPIYGTKRFGGSSAGMWGCVAGLIIGIWFGPLGIIFGPFLGAFAGELIANANTDRALKAAFGSFLGFLAGTLIKLVTCFVMIYYFIDAF